jgi:putative spermidine/putrescine transport system ATP-binding protein
VTGGSTLELQGLGKSYGRVGAVRDVSLDIAAGEFVAFLGPSGSGKTTTLMMIAGFATPDAGRILLDGADITALPPHRRNLGMVYQNYALFPHLSVERNVAFPLEMRRMERSEIRQRVRRALELVQLAEMGARRPGQLSGGQQQRVALARALVFEPPVLLMDEPLGALDRQLRGEMQHEIRAIQRRLGITTVYVTHDQEEALSMADRVVVMRDGRIEQAAPPTTLYDRPETAFVAAFIGAANLLTGRILRDGGAARLRTAGGLEFAVPADADRTPDATVTAVIRPERIVIGDPPADAPTRVAAVIDEAAFVGGQWRYRARLGTGEQVMVAASNQGGAPHGADDRVTLSWRAGDVWILPEGR